METIITEDVLAARMANMRDEQLSEIAFARPEDGIREEFAVAARAELERRGLSDEAKAGLQKTTAAIRNGSSEMPGVRLGWFGIVLTLIGGPILPFSIGAAVALYLTGYKTKAKDVLMCIPLSFGIYVLIVFLVS